MAAAEFVYRIHPAIGFARVGNSDEYCLAPETMAGLDVPGEGTATGGLPIRPGTESETIRSNDLRDGNGALKRQAVRFRIFQYPRAHAADYPCPGGVEITLGAPAHGRRLVDILWTVHLANKKANSYVFNESLGIAVYERAHAAQLQVRNPALGHDLGNATRLKRLVIDPGPRAIRGTDPGCVRLDAKTPASFAQGAHVRTINDYPKSFPDDSFAPLYAPTGRIDSLGDLSTDARGRLIAAGGYGKACAWCREDGRPYPLLHGEVSPGVVGDVNENGWFDDSGDGPVSAVLVFDDGSTQAVHGAWLVVAPPSYAPQTLNVVSLWDDVYDTWVRKLGLQPDVFGHRFHDSYEPAFDVDIHPILRAASLQRWTTNLPERAIEAHDAVGAIQPTDDPGDTILAGLAFIRDPNNERQFSDGAPFMPLAIGDVGKSFLSVTLTQYFFLTQWNRRRFRAHGVRLPGPGEQLDKCAMVNCMGGGFGPGIELTFVVRDPFLYQADWRDTGAGPFRIRARHFDYGQVQASQPVLSVGYVPLHAGPDGVLPAALEPGDASKFMALPWHTDFNACATHNVDPNPRASSTLYWAWPAQRPVQIHRAEDVRNGQLGAQKYSVRGKGTHSDDLGTAGRFQELIDIVLHWHRIGTVIQGSAIAGAVAHSPHQYLEVQSQLDEVEIQPWPMNSNRPGE